MDRMWRFRRNRKKIKEKEEETKTSVQSVQSSNQYCLRCNLELPLAKGGIIEDGGGKYHRYCYEEIRLIHKTTHINKRGSS